MKKTTKILVPIDFSDCSENALIYAMQLADEIGANLLVLNIPPFDTSNMDAALQSFKLHLILLVILFRIFIDIHCLSLFYLVL